MDTAYCDVCNRRTPFHVSPVNLFGKIDGIYYEYEGLEACCDICGYNRVDAKEIYKHNLEMLKQKAREDKRNIYVQN